MYPGVLEKFEPSSVEESQQRAEKIEILVDKLSGTNTDQEGSHELMAEIEAGKSRRLPVIA